MLEAYDDLLTADEACEALKIGKNALYALLAEKKLKAYKNGRVWRIPRLAIEEYIKTQASIGVQGVQTRLKRNVRFESK